MTSSATWVSQLVLTPQTQQGAYLPFPEEAQSVTDVTRLFRASVVTPRTAHVGPNRLPDAVAYPAAISMHLPAVVEQLNSEEETLSPVAMHVLLTLVLEHPNREALLPAFEKLLTKANQEFFQATVTSYAFAVGDTEHLSVKKSQRVTPHLRGQKGSQGNESDSKERGYVSSVTLVNVAKLRINPSALIGSGNVVTFNTMMIPTRSSIWNTEARKMLHSETPVVTDLWLLSHLEDKKLAFDYLTPGAVLHNPNWSNKEASDLMVNHLLVTESLGLPTFPSAGIPSLWPRDADPVLFSYFSGEALESHFSLSHLGTMLRLMTHPGAPLLGGETWLRTQLEKTALLHSMNVLPLAERSPDVLSVLLPWLEHEKVLSTEAVYQAVGRLVTLKKEFADVDPLHMGLHGLFPRTYVPSLEKETEVSIKKYQTLALAL